MSETLKVDPIDAVAVTLLSSALIERCQDMLVRLTTSASYPVEVADFRDDAIRHITSNIPEDLSPDEASEAVRTACKAVEQLAAAWIEGQQTGTIVT